MAALAYTDLTNLVNDSTITQTKAEACLRQAQYLMNVYGCNLSLWSSYDVASKEAAGILAVAVEIYAQYYKSAGASSSSYNLGGLGVAQSSGGGGGATSVHNVARIAAKNLLTHDFHKY